MKGMSADSTFLSQSHVGMGSCLWFVFVVRSVCAYVAEFCVDGHGSIFLGLFVFAMEDAQTLSKFTSLSSFKKQYCFLSWFLGRHCSHWCDGGFCAASSYQEEHFDEVETRALERGSTNGHGRRSVVLTSAAVSRHGNLARSRTSGEPASSPLFSSRIPDI